MKKRKVKWKMVISFLIIFISIIAIYNIIKWNFDNHKTSQIIDKIEEITIIQEVEENSGNIENIEIIEQEEEIDEFNPYWDYIKMKLIDVEFSDLYEVNNDTKGWIQVNGTNINYPFVQATDNKYYLTHTFDRSYNAAGWVFLDYRNDLDNLDKNTIIYAHGRIDKTMFGSLRNILTSGWLNNTSNYVIKLSAQKHNTLWQVFSVYHIPTTNDYIRVNFKNNKNFLEFANMLIERSSYDFNTTVNENDHILTLSTCYSDTEKVVLHAKLIKKETR